jgi:hypothetical protein
MRKISHQEKHTHTQNSYCSRHDPFITMFFMGQILVKIQLEKYDFKLLYKEKKFMEKVTQIRQNLKKINPNHQIFLISLSR